MSTVLKAKARSNQRRSQLSELRAQGNVPAVVYGYQVENTPIFINGAEFLKTMREVGRNGVIALDVDGKTLNFILHEYQEDSIRKEVIHADFLVVDLTVAIEANVRVEILGDAAGAGIVQHALLELGITAKPDEIPEVISVDIAGLEIGESVSVGDIRGNYSCVINHEDDEAIVSIQPPREEEPEASEEADNSAAEKDSE
jgi:large subunit ribosomal protein L25